MLLFYPYRNGLASKLAGGVVSFVINEIGPNLNVKMKPPEINLIDNFQSDDGGFFSTAHHAGLPCCIFCS